MKIGFPALLGLLFIGLKLGHVIAWSWWLVLLPLYAVPALAVATVTLVAAVWCVFYAVLILTVGFAEARRQVAAERLAIRTK